METINLAEKLSRFDDLWSPKVVGALNGQLVKLAKVHGEYVWHAHGNEDELFLVIEGRLDIRFRDRTVALGPGEMCIVPRGVEHQPFAPESASILLFEPATVRSTGDVDDALTVEPDDLEWI